MKKTLRLLTVLSATFLLASCEIHFGPIESSSSLDEESSSDIIIESSSEEIIESSSEEEAPPTPVHEKTAMSCTYDEFHTNNYYTIDNAPTLGQADLLVIPVWFEDSSSFITSTEAKDTVRNDIDTCFFGEAKDTGWQTVRSFYEGESFGRLVVDGKTTDWYSCGKSSSDISSSGDVSNIINSATKWYFDNNPTDSRRNYDGNGDGYLDTVVCVYAVPDYARSGSGNSNFWAYTYWMQNARYKNVSNPGVNTYFWSSYDFMYSSQTSYEKTGTSYGGGDNTNFKLDCHTFIHEMGHAFGLDDLYDYSDYDYNPAGMSTMQDYNVCGHDPFSTIGYGWTDPYIVEDPGDYVLKPFQSSHDVLLLTNQWNEYNSPFDEYLLVELYTPTGMNAMDSYHALSGRRAGPTGTGIRVWHIDARLLAVDENGQVGVNSLTSNVNASGMGVIQAFNNSYGGSHASILGEDYYDYNLVQYIRNSTSDTYAIKGNITNDNMFHNGDSFSMYNYDKQFVNGNKMNNGESLGWGFYVQIEGTNEDAVATISVYSE